MTVVNIFFKISYRCKYFTNFLEIKWIFVNIRHIDLRIVVFNYLQGRVVRRKKNEKLLTDAKMASIIKQAKSLGAKSFATFFKDEFFDEILKELPGNAKAKKHTDKHKNRWKGIFRNKRNSYYADIINGKPLSLFYLILSLAEEYFNTIFFS